MVQSPDDARFSGMPLSAQSTFDVDYGLPVREIASELSVLVGQAVPEARGEPGLAAGSSRNGHGVGDLVEGWNGKLTELICPEYGGPFVRFKSVRSPGTRA